MAARNNYYVDHAGGNDYIGASFVDGAYTSATKTLVKAGAFAATKVNHWLYLESNDGGSIVAGYYKVATWSDANTVILATDAGAGVDDDAAKCTQHDGTALLPFHSVQGALDLITRDATDGDQINVKAGTSMTITAAWTYATYGTPTAAAPLVIRGYTTTAEDGGHGAIVLSGNIQLTSASWTYTSLIHMDISGSGAQTNWILSWGNYNYLRGCIFTSGGITNGPSVGTGVISGCKFDGFSLYATRTTTALTIGNYIVNCGAGLTTIGSCQLIGNIVLMNGNGIGIDVANQIAYAVGNIVYNLAAGTGIGIKIGDVAGLQLGAAMNNIVCGYSGAGGVGIGSGTLNAQAAGYNAFWNNTTNESYGHQVLDDLGGDVSLAADPFTSASTGDFSLTAAAKTALSSLGWPASYLGAHANTDPHITIGAIQMQATACDYPAEADVEFGVAYSTYTGAFVVPAEADVESGVDYGAAAEFTGTYDPMAAAVFPAVANTLEAEAAFGPTGAEYAGTYHAPDAAEVIDTAVFGAASATPGTFAVPAEADVRDAETYGSAAEFTGTLDLPAVTDVQSGVQFDGLTKTGTFAAPAVTDVQSGVTYGAAAEYTGTFTEPGIGNVEAGVDYGGGGTEFSGTFVVPSESDVLTGVTYGDTAEFTGTLAVADYPAVGDVEAGVTFGGGALTGTFAVPAVGDVQEAVTYGNAAEFTGTLDVPAVTDVKLGVKYGEDGTEFTGTYEASTTVNAITGGNVTTIQGDDYDSADGRQLDWTVSSTATLTGGTVAVIIPGVDTYTGSVVNETTIRLELTAAQTAAIPVGRRKYQVIVTQTVALGSDKITVVEGTWTSNARVTE